MFSCYGFYYFFKSSCLPNVFVLSKFVFLVVFQQKQLFEDWDKIPGKFITEKETRGQEGSHQLSGIYVNVLGIIGCIGKLQGAMKRRTKIIWRKLLFAVSYINIH